MSLPQAFASFLLGFLYLLVGYRTIRFGMKVESALLFMGLGALAWSQTDLNPRLLAALAILLGLLGWKLGNAWYALHLIFAGSILGALVASALMKPFGEESQAWVGLIGALIGTVLAFRVQRPMVILATASIGSILLTLAAVAASQLYGVPPLWTWEATLLCGTLMVFGTVYQLQTTKTPPEPRKR